MTELVNVDGLQQHIIKSRIKSHLREVLVRVKYRTTLMRVRIPPFSLNRYNMSNWIKTIEVRTSPVSEKDSTTGGKLDKEYLFVSELCVLHKNPTPNVEYFNRESTPKNLMRHWDKWDEYKKGRISRIKEIMAKCNIKKSDL